MSNKTVNLCSVFVVTAAQKLDVRILINEKPEKLRTVLKRKPCNTVTRTHVYGSIYGFPDGRREY